MATIGGLIDYIDGLKPNSYTDEQKLIWLNEVEQVIKEEVMCNYIKTNIARVAETAEYDLPLGVMFEDIETVYISSSPIPRIDNRRYIDTYNGELGYYKPTEENQIGISPTPLITDDSEYPMLQVSYLERFVEYDDDETDVLINQSRYQKIYVFYIMAQIDLFNKEFESYNNMIAQYNAIMNDYKEWYDTRSAKDITESVMNIMNVL